MIISVVIEGYVAIGVNQKAQRSGVDSEVSAGFNEIIRRLDFFGSFFYQWTAQHIMNTRANNKEGE